MASTAASTNATVRASATTIKRRGFGGGGASDVSETGVGTDGALCGNGVLPSIDGVYHRAAGLAGLSSPMAARSTAEGAVSPRWRLCADGDC